MRGLRSCWFADGFLLLCVSIVESARSTIVVAVAVSLAGSYVCLSKAAMSVFNRKVHWTWSPVPVFARLEDIDVLIEKIVGEVTALEEKGGEQGAENSEYTFLAAVEAVSQFSCPVCGNKVRMICTACAR